MVAGKLEKLNKTDSRKYENVANYHAFPYMCDADWKCSYPSGHADHACCHSVDSVFTSWHRLYVVHFAESLAR